MAGFLKKVGQVIGRGAGLVAKSAVSVGKTIFGVGSSTDTKTAKATAQAAQAVKEAANIQKQKAQAQQIRALAQQRLKIQLKKVADLKAAGKSIPEQKKQTIKKLQQIAGAASVGAGQVAMSADELKSMTSVLDEPSQSGFGARLQLAIVWEWLMENWYVPLLILIGLFGWFFYKGKSKSRKKR